MRRLLIAFLPLLLAAPGPSLAADRHPFGIDDMLKMVRISDPQPSPDGRWVVFTAGKPNLKTNKVEKDLWIVSADGGTPRRLTTAEGPDYGARWSPDGRAIAFIGVRGGKAHVWTIGPQGGAPRQLTHLPVDVDNVGFSPDGSWLSFTAEVFPDCPDLACTARRDAEREKDAVKARSYEELLFRHWDAWEDGKRSHLFVMPARGGLALDPTPGMEADAPTKPWGGTEEIAFAPDGSEIAFAANLSKDPAWNTNTDVFAVNLATRERRCVSCPNEATDTQPAYSPDGKWLAYLAMARPGYESDRFRIVLFDRATGGRRVLTEGWDRSPGSIAWAQGSRTIFATASEHGRQKIFAVDIASGSVRTIVGDHYNSGVAVAGDRIVFTQDGFTFPAEVMSCRHDGSDCRRLTAMNKAVLDGVIMSEPEEVHFKGAGGDDVQGWFLKPVGFREGERYPLAYFIHGGPQGSWDDHFHHRWNIMVAAGRGYAAATVNFHGSTGFGQNFTDSIRGDWGGKPYRDIMKGLDRVLADHPWIDAERACALGASFGGYMVNWIAGQTDRFACLVSHDGEFSTHSSYFNTEELWFPEWDMKGTAIDHPERYERWSPDRFVKRWRTPMLVIHGANDFRVVDTEGMSAFTALRRQGVPARLLYFPDENHWVQKPANSRRWHEEVYGWLGRWTKK